MITKYCKARVPCGMTYYGCQRKATHGEYCWQHAPADPTKGDFCWQHAPVDSTKEKEEWWYLSRHGKPEKREVARSTKHRIWTLSGMQEDKRTQWGTYYPTREEAVQAYLSRLSRNVRQAEDSLERAKEEYANARETFE